MPAVRELLERFRPAGAPGRAGAAGVPADREKLAADELAPVFAALAEVERECDRIRQEAADAAAARRTDAAASARATVARARSEAAGIRAAAAARVREDIAAELAELSGRTAAEVSEVRRRNVRRQPQLLSMVVERVRDDLAALDGGASADPDGAVPADPDRGSR